MICKICSVPVEEHPTADHPKGFGVLPGPFGLRLTSRPQDSQVRICADCLRDLMSYVNVPEVAAAVVDGILPIRREPALQWPDDLEDYI